MNVQMQSFVDYVRTEMLSQMQTGIRGMAGSDSAMVPLRRAMMVPGKMIRPERKR
jgi:hypothetical protein